MLSMHELSLSMPEPMLSLSMLILATYPGSCVGIPDGLNPDRARMESGWAGMPDGPDGYTECRMGRMGYTGWVPDGF